VKHGNQEISMGYDPQSGYRGGFSYCGSVGGKCDDTVKGVVIQESSQLLIQPDKISGCLDQYKDIQSREVSFKHQDIY